MTEGPEVSFTIDTSALDKALGNLSSLSDSFGRQLTQGLASAVVQGRALEDVLRRIGLNLAGMALGQGLQPLGNLAGSAVSSILGGLSGLLPFEKGGVPGRVTPFAEGGIVSTPTFFPAGRNIGLMGEAGAEAIMPLSRGADGRLGVRMEGGAGRSVSVVMNITTPDVEGFRRSEGQIAAQMGRALARGQRNR